MPHKVTSLAIVFAVWAGIYLPALGSLEIKGEEGRRILPAVQMLEAGNFIVPQVGGEPYFSKPPLVNWLVAGSFKLFRARNEWTARLPSALLVLAAAVTFVIVGRSTIAALIWLTSFGLIEKGRLIEIEGLYVSLFAVAFICWFSWWRHKRSLWITWIVPWIFLGLGLLAKGPTHLFFFYAIVVAVLWQAGELRTLWNFRHVIGVVIMLSIFAAWAIPCAELAGSHLVTANWKSQMWLALADFKLRGWLLNVPRSLGYFLPWIIFLPLVVAGGVHTGPHERPRLQRALLLGTFVPLLVVDLIPGWLPRYGMPLVAPAAWLIAEKLVAEDARWPIWLGGKPFLWKNRERTIAVLVVTSCICIWIYALAIVPYLQRRAKVRPIAAQIDSLVPPSQGLYAVDPDFQPYLFYVRRHIVYAGSIDDLPREARYLLVQLENEEAAEAARQWLPAHPVPVLKIEDYRHIKTVLFAVQEPKQDRR